MSRAFGKFFFASNFKPCACTTIDAVSNFHISWSCKLGDARQIFKLMEAAILVKFSHYRSCKPASNFMCRQKLQQLHFRAAAN